MTTSNSRGKAKSKRRSRALKTLKCIGYVGGLLAANLLSGCEGSLGGTNSEGPGGSHSPLPAPGTIDENGYKVFAVPALDLEGAPYYSRAVLLTNAQWAKSVKAILNLGDEPTQANSFLAPVGGFTMFPNNELVLEVNNQMREAYQLAAAEIAATLQAAPNGIAQVNAGSDADAFIRTFGRRAFRRPLSDKEIAGYMKVYEIGAGLSGDAPTFVKGADLVVETMLQSPNFLYRTELSPGGGQLTGYEIAAKLSFWILGTSPNDALLDRAARGELNTAEGVSTIVDELLEAPEAAQMIVDLYSNLFKFTRYQDVIKDDPQFDPAINNELETVSQMFFQYIYEQEMGLDEILTSTKAFVGPKLASYYGITPAPSSPTLTELGPERPGYFSQVPYLMLMGDGVHSDAIHRGVFLNFQVMCATLPSPPGVIPQVPPPQPDQSDRERVEAHTGFGTCGEGCHGGYINPLGFAFENFDGLGRVRETSNGKPVDTLAAYPIRDEGMVEFNGAPELMSLLAGSIDAHRCFAKSMMSYALTRDIVEADQATIDELAALSMSDAGSIKEVLRALVKSSAFLSRPGDIQ